MATDGRSGLPLMINGDMKQKKQFSGVFVGQLRDHILGTKSDLYFQKSIRDQQEPIRICLVVCQNLSGTSRNPSNFYSWDPKVIYTVRNLSGTSRNPSVTLQLSAKIYQGPAGTLVIIFFVIKKCFVTQEIYQGPAGTHQELSSCLSKFIRGQQEPQKFFFSGSKSVL